jgi:hypothetical protein
MALYNFFSINLPYCLDFQPDGSMVALNREYKPIGFMTLDPIIYKNYPIYNKFKKIHPSTAKKLAVNPDWESEQRIYLYNDSCIPTSDDAYMKMYLEKIKIIAKLKLKEY